MRIHIIDLRFQGVSGIIASYLVDLGNELVLIETGPGSCHDALIGGIRVLGQEPSAIKHVFVTHIHLDHSGAAGWWAQQGATVYCHPNAAKHLVDPARLIESAQIVYGDAMKPLWGEILPAPVERVRVLQDDECVAIGGIMIKAWDTPGHARHHHAYLIDDICFTGDVAGVRLQNSLYISVAAAPPQFDPEPYVQSVDRLAAANLSKLYLTHFGEVTDPATHLAEYKRRIREVCEFIRAEFTNGTSPDETRERYKAFEQSRRPMDETLWRKYELANSTAMCADGIRLYCEKQASKP